MKAHAEEGSIECHIIGFHPQTQKLESPLCLHN